MTKAGVQEISRWAATSEIRKLGCDFQLTLLLQHHLAPHYRMIGAINRYNVPNASQKAIGTFFGGMSKQVVNTRKTYLMNHGEVRVQMAAGGVPKVTLEMTRAIKKALNEEAKKGEGIDYAKCRDLVCEFFLCGLLFSLGGKEGDWDGHVHGGM